MAVCLAPFRPWLSNKLDKGNVGESSLPHRAWGVVANRACVYGAVGGCQAEVEQLHVWRQLPFIEMMDVLLNESGVSLCREKFTEHALILWQVLLRCPVKRDSVYAVIHATDTAAAFSWY